MTIDWDKPLACSHGAVEYVSTSERNTKWVRLDNTEWAVAANGEPLDSWMPRVHNAKRKPKGGETWMFECSPIGGDSYLKAIFLDEGVGVGRICKPLYPLIKDPDF